MMRLQRVVSSQEGNMRSKLRTEYNELVHNMFSTCDTLRHRFDEFRLAARFHELWLVEKIFLNNRQKLW